MSQEDISQTSHIVCRLVHPGLRPLFDTTNLRLHISSFDHGEAIVHKLSFQAATTTTTTAAQPQLTRLNKRLQQRKIAAPTRLANIKQSDYR
jgi:hypothetical protein